jgi:hypothetical protein
MNNGSNIIKNLNQIIKNYILLIHKKNTSLSLNFVCYVEEEIK